MIALEHMVLSATALGYGTCWIGAFNADEVKRLLKIPEAMTIVALLPIGVPDEKPKPRPRRDFHEIFYKEEWQKPLILKDHHPQLDK
jgi:nitroreductase